MYVLGINGWPGASHDGAACLLADGEVVAFAEEERFSRHKHAYGEAPLAAAAYCLARAGLTLADIDVVAHGWQMPTLLTRRGLPWFRDDQEAMEFLLPRRFFPRQRDPRLVFVPHHLAHAASAYHLSGYDRGAILVLDGQGEAESATLARGVGGRIEVLRSFSPGWSLGYFYAAVCEHIGLGADAAGKMMGLAAHGTPGDLSFGGALRLLGDEYEVDAVPRDLLSTGRTDEETDTIGLWAAHLSRVLELPRNEVTVRYDPERARLTPRTLRDPFDYRDVAATAQAALEEIVIGMVRGLLRDTGESTLLVAGGVGFNASLNGMLARLPGVTRFFAQPLAGDQGVSLGAACWVAAREGETIRPMSESVAWGPDWSAGSLRAVLDRAGVSYTEPEDIAAATAELLAAGRAVGWFQGRGEGGPRALGQRSILAAPFPVETRDRINLQVKDREWWRPFAPSLHEEAADELLGLSAPLPYMIVTTPVPDRSLERIPAVVHVDGTTRPQTVSAAANPLYHRLLGQVARHTGHPVVLNTSFNGRAEPIVWTARDALDTFARCPLDALALGPFLVGRVR